MRAGDKRGRATGALSDKLPTQADFHAAIASRSSYWFSACLRITHSRELAEDAVQDALLNAWTKRHQFNKESRLETWIHRIAVNSALQLIRKQKPGVFNSLEIDYGDEAEAPHKKLDDLDLDSSLDRACLHLTELERTCFLLKHLEDWRQKEIADVLGINVSAVKQAVFRGVKKLRVHMTGLQETTP